MKLMQAAVLLAAWGAVAPVHADIIYNSLASGTDGVSIPEPIIVDDIRIDSGGQISDISFAATASGDGEFVTTGGAVGIVLDGGDGVPQFGPVGDDIPLWFEELDPIDVIVGGDSWALDSE